jgi:hypothetical protein
LAIDEKTIACKNKVSDGIYKDAISQKMAILLMTKPAESIKEQYINLPLEDKKHIAALGSAPSVRAYILVSGLIEDSLSETQAALEKADRAIRRSGDYKDIEEVLTKDAVMKVLEKHTDWDLSDYGYGEKKPAPDAATEAPAEEKPAEEKPAEAQPSDKKDDEPKADK